MTIKFSLKKIDGVSFIYRYYYCVDTQERFTNTQLDEENLASLKKGTKQ